MLWSTFKNCAILRITSSGTFISSLMYAKYTADWYRSAFLVLHQNIAVFLKQHYKTPDFGRDWQLCCSNRYFTDTTHRPLTYESTPRTLWVFLSRHASKYRSFHRQNYFANNFGRHYATILTYDNYASTCCKRTFLATHPNIPFLYNKVLLSV